jgi:hypothetical protein
VCWCGGARHLWRFKADTERGDRIVSTFLSRSTVKRPEGRGPGAGQLNRSRFGATGYFARLSISKRIQIYKLTATKAEPKITKMMGISQRSANEGETNPDYCMEVSAGYLHKV